MAQVVRSDDIDAIMSMGSTRDQMVYLYDILRWSDGAQVVRGNQATPSLLDDRKWRIVLHFLNGRHFEHKDQMDLTTMSFKTWWSQQGKTIFFGDSETSGRMEFIGATMQNTCGRLCLISFYPVHDVNPSAEQQILALQVGSRNCVIGPMLDDCERHIENGTSESSIHKWVRRRKQLLEFDAKLKGVGVTEDMLRELSTMLKVTIVLLSPFTATPTRVFSHPCSQRRYQFLVTRHNHVELVCDASTNIVVPDADELAARLRSMTLAGSFCMFKGQRDRPTQVYTKDGVYSYVTTFASLMRDFNDDNGGGVYAINPDKSPLVSRFLYVGLHHNQRMDIRPPSADLKLLDMKNAYVQYKASPYYVGFPGLFTDFRRVDCEQGIGYYQIDDLVIEPDTPLGRLNAALNVYQGKHVYPSPELAFLRKHGARFRVVAGLWGVSVVHLTLDSDKYKVRLHPITDDACEDGGIRAYCKIVGCFALRSPGVSTWKMTGTMEDAKSIYGSYLASCKTTGADPPSHVFDYVYDAHPGTVRVQYPTGMSSHHMHWFGFITSYMRLHVFDQLVTMDMDRVVCVLTDGIYYDGPGDPVFNSDIWAFKECCYTPCAFAPATDVCGAPTYLTRMYPYEQDVPAPRPFHRLELFMGAPGNGKTHYQLTDDGLLNVLYVPPTYKLLLAKKREFPSLNAVVLAFLLLGSGDEVARVLRHVAVVLVDECSRLTEQDKQAVIRLCQNRRVVFMGDIGYQIGPIIGEEMTSHGLHVTEMTHNFRFASCISMQQKICRVRDMIAVGGPGHAVAAYVKSVFRCVKWDDMAYLYYYETDMILTFTNAMKDIVTAMFSDMPKWVILETKGGYANNEVVCNQRPVGVKTELRHGFTTHSTQGETVDGRVFIIISEFTHDARLLYTSLSRTRTDDQIYIVT